MPHVLAAADDVLAAAARIAAHAAATPVLRSRSLDALAGCRLYFKGEHLQRSGAFKFRGACHAVVPEGAVAAKLANIQRHGATVWRCAATQAAREDTCAQVQADTGAQLVHPYADARVIAGQGTAALELATHMAGLDGPPELLVVPVGGGGLAAGSALALAAAAPDCQLVLAEPAGADDTARSLAGGARCVEFVPDTVCDGLRGALGAPNFTLLRACGAEVVTIQDSATVAAMQLAWQVLKQVIEPSSAIALAAVLAQPQRFAGRRVGVILSGGNVDLEVLPWQR